MRSFGALACGGLICSLFVFCSVLSLFWVPYDVTELSIDRQLHPPSRHHWFGTDHLGRDILSMMMVGSRVSLGIAGLAVCVSTMIGVPLGLLAARRRGWWLDAVMMRCGDVLFAFPALLIATLVSTILEPGIPVVILSVGIFGVPVFMRVVRSAALVIWEGDFVKAARLCGKGSLRISLEHILPNVLPLIYVQMSVHFSLALLLEASLAYIGFGVQPPCPSWGRMLVESQTFMVMAPHSALIPGIVVTVMILGASWLGDGLRDGFVARVHRNAS